MNLPSGILAGSFGGVDWLRVEGKGNFQNSADLKAFASSRIATGRRCFVLDLARCTGMDSTFMGTLTCVALKLSDDDGCLHVVNAAGRNGELLRGLGLDSLFPVSDGPGDMDACGCTGSRASVEAVPRQRCTMTEQTEVCLEAHEALVSVAEENEEKFRDVIDLMKLSLHPGGKEG